MGFLTSYSVVVLLVLSSTDKILPLVSIILVIVVNCFDPQPLTHNWCCNDYL